MEHLVSVIVPIHNTQKYLKKCLNSIINQTYKNLEILLINDGSTDKSASIIENFAKLDSRIKVFTHEVAQGVDKARNVGLDNATGEFISFVDADDWIPKNAISILLKGIVENDADLSEGDFKTVGSNVKQTYSGKEAIYNTDTKELKLKALIHLRGAIWGKLYKLSIINENNIRFKNQILEDSIFDFTYNLYSNKRVAIYSKVYYYNRIVTGGLSRKIPPKMKQCFEFAVDTFLENMKEVSWVWGFWNVIDSFIKVTIERLIACDKETALKNIEDVRSILNNSLEKHNLKNLREESFIKKFLEDSVLDNYNLFYNRCLSKQVKIKKLIKKSTSPFMYFFIIKLNWFYND